MTLLEQFDIQAKSIIGWPKCTCGASDYRHVRWEGIIQWIEPTGVMRPKRQKFCEHRRVKRLLIEAYRRGRKDALRRN